MTLTPQNVANSPTNSYPVGKFNATIGGLLCEIQGVALVSSAGVEYNGGNPFPITGTFTVSPSIPTLTPTRVTFTSGVSKELAAANSSRVSGAFVVNNTDESFFLQVAADAVLDQGIFLAPHSIWQITTKQQIKGIYTNAGTAILDLYEAT